MQSRGWEDVKAIRELSDKVEKNTDRIAENTREIKEVAGKISDCLLYTSISSRDFHSWWLVMSRIINKELKASNGRCFQVLKKNYCKRILSLLS